MTRQISTIVTGLLIIASAGCGAAADARQEVGFNKDWRFAKGAQPGAAQVSFDDSGWQALRVPHDWAIAGPFNANGSGNTGKLPWQGEGWYRKAFKLDAADAGKRVYLDFDGVMAEPKVYVNGKLAGQWDYGYIPFRVDLTPHVKFGGANVVAVHCDTRNHGSRWYPGAGIFRDVELVITDPVHVAHWGVYVTTPQVSDDQATVKVRTEIDNHLGAAQPIELVTRIVDPAGDPVAALNVETKVAANATQPIEGTVKIADPKRWDVEHPNQYTLVTEVKRGGEVVDRVETKFGVRTFKWTADDGFHLNGRRLQLYGVNLHHDLGPLGAAFNRRAMQRQLEIMQEMGVNAIRTSHNAPAEELLDLCDEMGLVVFDEAFDKWDHTATYHGGDAHFDAYFKRQLTNFVRRDRNHPSIVVWSIGNEIGYVLSNKNNKWKPKVDMLVEHVRGLDPTRPITMGNHGTGAVTNKNNHVLENVDIMSWNYNRKYALAKERYPDKPTIYSESASALSERGFYHLPLPAHKTDYVVPSRQVNSYDMNAATWSDIADVDFYRMETDRYCSGEFVWTGFDYIGEPTPFNDEWVKKNGLTQADASRSSYFGIVDLAGIPKDRYWLYRSHWRPDATTVHVLPHWNWPGREGKPVPVMVYTNGDEAELWLNGKSLGRKAKGGKPIAAPVDLAHKKKAKASSEETDRRNWAWNGSDGDMESRWCAEDEATDQWWQSDLGKVQPIKSCVIHWEQAANNYKYKVQVSVDGKEWKTVATRDKFEGEGSTSVHEFDARGRYVKIVFTDLQYGAWASFYECDVYSTKPPKQQQQLVPYYAPMDRYRIRWMDVPYEPGELKVVAYKDGKPIGETRMVTSGKPAQLRLTPDRATIDADGDDLSFVLVEALDAKGNPCHLADNLVKFELDGPGKIVAVGNGAPRSLEPFVAEQRSLYYGKAIVVVRSLDGDAGKVKLTATSDGMAEAMTRISTRSK